MTYNEHGNKPDRARAFTSLCLIGMYVFFLVVVPILAFPSALILGVPFAYGLIYMVWGDVKELWQ